MIEPYDARAQDNHGGQDLKRLAERGGLSPKEALAVLDDKGYWDSPWRYQNWKAARAEIVRRAQAWKEANP